MYLENNLYVVGAAFGAPDSVVRPMFSKITSAVKGLGITTELITLDTANMAAGCPYSDFREYYPHHDELVAEIADSKGVVVINPESHRHVDGAELHFGIGDAVRSLVVAATGKVFVTARRPSFSKGQAYASEIWPEIVRLFADAQELKGDMGKLATTLQ